MRNLAIGMTATMLLGAAQGARAETLITAQDYAVDSDVVLESAVREIKSAPRDTANVIGDSIKYVADETVTAAKGIKAAFAGPTPHENTQKAGEQEIANAWTSSNDILFRSYKVSDTVGNELTQGQEATEGSIDVSSAFPGVEFPKGTSVYYRPEFNKLFVRQTLENVLAIEDVLAEQHNAQRELMGHQVEIETKFVEVSQSTLNELGFNWTFVDKHGGDASIFENLVLPAGQALLSEGLRTAAGALAGNTASGAMSVNKVAGSLRWQMVINALEQADDTDVLSAPRIVTRDGNTATIQVGEERMVPKRFSASSQNTSIYVEHSDWDAELMGVTLEVTPEIRSEELIDLELKPKVVDLLGYDNYQVTPSNAHMWPIHGQAYRNSMGWGRFPVLSGTFDAAGNFVTNSVGKIYNAILSENQTQLDNVNDNENSSNYKAASYNYYDNSREWDMEELIAVPSLEGKLPYFRIREMETQVTVADGSTVGMGGLIYDKLETYRDKVPVLGSIPFIGRLFRSEGEKSVKRNLMIFVTATQVDVNGRRAADLALNK